ncbi:hypothetical protein F442_22572 [Phytophthora nicotianae P10297]|uniref:Uncharacterized protein n=1 Tax=Phytophthora nicotianae P10297 TaxID=1317064 RepID=W2XZJ9_PHYNI|nr:hypothetical protein F442_22572 [Phytophthora nicotianae P10297]
MKNGLIYTRYRQDITSPRMSLHLIKHAPTAATLARSCFLQP